MLANLSELQIKLVTAVVLADAKEIEDYVYYLIPLALGIAFTASQTLFFVNKAMKYYDQMVVMPIY